jgi:hypothetical protein
MFERDSIWCESVGSPSHTMKVARLCTAAKFQAQELLNPVSMDIMFPATTLPRNPEVTLPYQ